jgi:hypothetical protein
MKINFTIPGSLAGQFETDLNSMEALINRLNTELGIGLEHHGRNERAAVWSAGNRLIVARAVDNRLTELELINFRREQSDPIAGRAWGYLTDRLKQSGILWQPVQDYERVAKKTLAFFPPEPDITPEIIEAWRAKYNISDDDMASFEAATEGSERIQQAEMKNPGLKVRKVEVSLWEFARQTPAYQARLLGGNPYANLSNEQAAEKYLGEDAQPATADQDKPKTTQANLIGSAQENRDVQESWENEVPDLDNRMIIKNLRQGHPVRVMAKSLGVEDKTIYNRESALRIQLGYDIVPFRKEWRKRKESRKRER